MIIALANAEERRFAKMLRRLLGLNARRKRMVLLTLLSFVSLC